MTCVHGEIFNDTVPFFHLFFFQENLLVLERSAVWVVYQTVRYEFIFLCHLQFLFTLVHGILKLVFIFELLVNIFLISIQQIQATDFYFALVF